MVHMYNLLKFVFNVKLVHHLILLFLLVLATKVVNQYYSLDFVLYKYL